MFVSGTLVASLLTLLIFALVARVLCVGLTVFAMFTLRLLRALLNALVCTVVLLTAFVVVAFS